MHYELSGKLSEKFDTIQRTETFKVREFVVEKSDDINGKTITNLIKFQCTQDRTSLLDSFNTGDQVKVYFNIRGTRWEKEGRVSYFNNLDAWRIEAEVQATDGGTDEVPLEPLDTFSNASDEAIDDLPF